jgi:hypothetical protein
VGGVENEAERTAVEGRHGDPRDVSDLSRLSGSSAGGPGTDGLDPDSLRSRLDAIEGRPLDQHAAALAELHDELRARLEGGDAAAARG